MKNILRFLASFSILILFFVHSFSQSEGSPVKEVKENRTYKLIGPLTLKKAENMTCTNNTAKICGNNKVKVVSRTDQGDGTVLVKLQAKTSFSTTDKSGTEICTSEVVEDGIYCIDEKTLVENIKIPDILPSIGILSVPFKFQTKDFKIYSSGNLGGFFGVQHRINWDPFGEDSFIFIVGAAGYSNIPLNNVNASAPDNVDDVGAFTYGVSGGLAIGRFQVMAIKGWDYYNVDNEKQNRSWISIGLGFGFLKPQ